MLIVASIAVLVTAIIGRDGSLIPDPFEIFGAVIVGTVIGTLATSLILGLYHLPSAIGATT